MELLQQCQQWCKQNEHQKLMDALETLAGVSFVVQPHRPSALSGRGCY